MMTELLHPLLSDLASALTSLREAWQAGLDHGPLEAARVAQRALEAALEAAAASLGDEPQASVLRGYLAGVDEELTASLAAAEARGSQAAADRVALQVEPLVALFRLRVASIEASREDPDAAAQIARLAALRDDPTPTRDGHRASIVVCAFNKVELTRRAVDSVLAHTDLAGGAYELILVNNGSSDGTEVYFDSVAGARVIHLRRNNGPVDGFDAGISVAQGRAIVTVSNDVVVTAGWLERLLAPIEADPRVALVVPVCNAISNAQTVPVTYGRDLRGLADFARQLAETNAGLYEERARLMPFVSVMPTRLLDQGWVLDRRYRLAEFLDDDFCTVLRRAGYRMLLVKDAFVHHEDGATLSKTRAEKSLHAMRSVYYAKWGVDAWDALTTLREMGLLVSEAPCEAGASLLAVDPLFGETALLVANLQRALGRPLGRRAAMVVDERFAPDAQWLFDAVWPVGPDGGPDGAGDEQFDLVVLCRELGEIIVGDPRPLLAGLLSRVKPGGRLAFRVRNPRSIAVLSTLLDDRQEGRYAEPSWMLPLFPVTALLAWLRPMVRGIEQDGLPISDEAKAAVVPGLAERVAKVRPELQKLMQLDCFRIVVTR